MDCLVRAFSEFTGISIETFEHRIGHKAPHHIQEIIEAIGNEWSITEISCKDIDPSCPYDHSRLAHWISRYSGVLTYWTRPATQHAIIWHPGMTLLPDHTISIFWIIEPRQNRFSSDLTFKP